MTDSMRDWNPTLRKNAAVCQLAGEIWNRRCEAYGGQADLTLQPVGVRQRFVEIANEILNMVQPTPAGQTARPTFRIVPKPDGAA